MILGGAAAIFLVIAAIVVVHGTPVADDYVRCTRYEQAGFMGQLADVLAYRGIVRPFRLVEVSVIGALCRQVPFGLLVLPGVAFTLWVAWQARRLLRDLQVPAPWTDVGSGLWLLHPVGSEAALWPSAMHVPLGLALGLLSLRRFRAGRLTAGTTLALAAYACLEQLLFVLPVAAWLVAPRGRARGAAAASAAVTVGVLIVYGLLPGTEPRTNIALVQRLLNVGRDLEFYLRFPLIGLGLHSISLAAIWAFPVSVVVFAAGLLGGATLFDRGLAGQLATQCGSARWPRSVATAAVLAALVNLPTLSTVPRDDSPRIFSPTWLLLALVVAYVASQVSWERSARRRLAGAVTGLFVAGAALSLSFSVWARLTSDHLTVPALDRVAVVASDGDTVALCRVPPKAVTPAPAGAYSLHLFFYDWVAQPALRYHTGRAASFRIGDAGSCPEILGADIVMDFDELVGDRALPDDGGLP